MAFSNETNVFRQQFNTKVRELLETKRDDNNSIFTRERYNNLVATVKNIKVKQRKEPTDYRRLARYDVLVAGDREMLIKPIKEPNSVVKYYIASDELFDVLHGTHINIGHAGRNKMVQELKSMYCNITKEVIMIYLSLCKQCNHKKGFQVKKVISKPTVSMNLNSRGQVDIIDMETKPSGEYRFIMVYQDHLTKFVMLRALRTNANEVIAHHLLDIFTTIGVPVILQSNNGRDFCSDVIKELRSLWKDIRLVHGNTHGQSQIAIIENSLLKWMNENKTTDWVMGLKFVQFARNRTYHEDVKKSPFEAMFGCKARVGLSLCLPKDQMEELESEEDLERVMQSLDDSSIAKEEDITIEAGPSIIKEENCVVCNKPAIDSDSCVECGGTIHKTCSGSSENEEKYGCNVICALCTQPSKKVKKEPEDNFL